VGFGVQKLHEVAILISRSYLEFASKKVVRLAEIQFQHGVSRRVDREWLSIYWFLFMLVLPGIIPFKIQVIHVSHLQNQQ